MSGLSKKLVLSAVIVLLLVGVGWYYNRIESLEMLAQLQARTLDAARNAAVAKATLEEYVLLAEEAPSRLDIPGFDGGASDACFPKKASLEIYRRVADTKIDESRADYMHKLRYEPESTRIYAFEFNTVMLKEMKEKKVADCA